MSATYPIPLDALDDRLAFVGTSGSGKTYAAGTAVERLIARKSRIVIVDPLGVWYGLRLARDGRAAGFPVVIFGGEHGDLPLNEHAGKLVGETVAGMAESCIVSLDGLGTKSAERRFMLAFLETLYRRASGEPVHLIFDEADLWAPQKSSEPQLQALMENIVRRGRVKGFLPWLITQRPAVLSKDVLSQADGLVAMKLTASQDRDALGAWIEGQADRAEEKRILAALPQLERGRGVVWLPGRGVLQEATFPEKATFDSSRTPKRGEKKRSTTLKPIDLGKLKERLASVEAETKANDPRALKVRIADLEREARAMPALQTDPQEIERANRRGYDRGWAEGFEAGVEVGWEAARDASAEALGRSPPKRLAAKGVEPLKRQVTSAPKAQVSASSPRPTTARLAPTAKAVVVDVSLTGPQRQVLQALRWWQAMGHDAPVREQIAAIVGWRATSGHLKNVVGSLSTAGMVSYPSQGRVSLTPAGAAAAPEPDTGANVIDGVRGTLTGPQRQVVDALLAAEGSLSRDQIAAACSWAPTSGHLKNVVGSLSTLRVVEYPSQGIVALQSWVRS